MGPFWAVVVYCCRSRSAIDVCPKNVAGVGKFVITFLGFGNFLATVQMCIVCPCFHRRKRTGESDKDTRTQRQIAEKTWNICFCLEHEVILTRTNSRIDNRHLSQKVLKDILLRVFFSIELESMSVSCPQQAVCLHVLFVFFPEIESKTCRHLDKQRTLRNHKVATFDMKMATLPTFCAAWRDQEREEQFTCTEVTGLRKVLFLFSTCHSQAGTCHHFPSFKMNLNNV